MCGQAWKRSRESSRPPGCGGDTTFTIIEEHAADHRATFDEIDLPRPVVKGGGEGGLFTDGKERSVGDTLEKKVQGKELTSPARRPRQG